MSKLSLSFGGKGLSSRQKNKFKQMLTNPVYIISFASIVFLFYTIALPLIKIIITTFQWQVTDVGKYQGAELGKFTTAQWIDVFTSSISRNLFYKPMLHSLSIGICVSVLSLIIGCALAWLITRTDMPLKKTFAFLSILPYMFPSWYKAFAWLIIFKNSRMGGSMGLLQHLGWNPPNWLSYGFLPIVLTLSAHYYAYSYLLISAALSSMNSSLEETAGIMGASRFTILQKITFPLVLPAVLSTFVLTISKAIGTFSVPSFLGSPVRYTTISTMIYSSIKSAKPVEGYILSLVLIVIAAAIILGNQKLLGRKNYSMIGGKDGRKTYIALGKWRKPITVLVGLFIFIVAIFPFIVLLWQTFMLKDGNFSPGNFTLHYWIGESNPAIASGDVGVLKNNRILMSLKNSVIMSLAGALIAAFIGLILGYAVIRGRDTKIAKVIDQVSFIPHLIPSIALSAVFLAIFAKKTAFVPALYGTMWILILITVVKQLPFAARSGSSTMTLISKELEEVKRRLRI